MCTVSIFPVSENDFVLTSNRDEAPNRIPISPNFYNVENTKMLFPKDKKAGGTWIGVSNKKRLICLLNGGFEFYKRKEKYRMSRGLVVTHLLAANEIIEAINTTNLEDIEPFTLVIADWKNSLKFYEMVWDGCHKHINKIPKEPRIWSSTTLYSEAMKATRKNWFDTFIKNNSLSAKTALHFHKNTHLENTEYGIVMDRGFVKTTSITQVIKTKEQVELTFEDIQSNNKSIKTLLTTQELYE